MDVWITLNYNPYAIEDNGSCEYPLDCGMILWALYDSYGDGWNNNYNVSEFFWSRWIV